jgi:hypothetical protein
MARKGLPLFFIHSCLYPSVERNADAHAQAAPPPRQRTPARDSRVPHASTETEIPLRRTNKALLGNASVRDGDAHREQDAIARLASSPRVVVRRSAEQQRPSVIAAEHAREAAQAFRQCHLIEHLPTLCDSAATLVHRVRAPDAALGVQRTTIRRDACLAQVCPHAPVPERAVVGDGERRITPPEGLAAINVRPSGVITDPLGNISPSAARFVEPFRSTLMRFVGVGSAPSRSKPKLPTYARPSDATTMSFACQSQGSARSACTCKSPSSARLKTRRSRIETISNEPSGSQPSPDG